MKTRAVPTTMKTESRPASSNYGRASGTSGTTGGSNGGNSNSSSIQQGAPASGTTRAQRVSSATRPGSSTYFDIANTILGSAGDLDDLLLNAARDGDYNKVEQLLVKRGDIIFDIDCKDKRTGNTALIWAAKRGHGKIVQLLLRHGADPTLRNYNAKTAVEEAMGATLTILLDAVSKATESSHRLLLQAAWQGNVEVIRRLLSNKVLDINCQNAEGLTPLMLVARDVHLFERLSRDLNMPYNPVEVAQELMKARADVHSRDSDGRSCLHYASQSMASIADKLTEAFLGGGSEPAQLDKRQYTPIHWASQHGNTNVVLALLDGGSEVNCRGFIGLTPLHISAHNDNQCTAVALLEHGADVTLTDDRGFTPVDLAKTRKLKSILKEAWTEATQNNAAQELAPVRTTPNRETGSRASGREESPARRRGGEVIFDGMPSNLVGGQRGSQATRAGTSRPMIGGSERARRAERQTMQEIENGRYTPSLLHGRDVTRPLGTVRNKPGPPVLPNISKAIPGPARQPSPESPPPSRRNSHDGDLRRSLEDGRNLLAHRSNAKRAALPTRGRLNKTTPVSTGDRSEQGEETGANSNIRRTHRRTGSDPYATKITDVAATIENIISNRRGETNKPDLHLLASSQHMSPLRLPLERETTLGVNIPTTIPEASSPSGSTNTISFETDNTSMARHSIMPTQMMALPPTSNRILPPTPTFLTQRSYTNLESALSRYAAGKDDDSSSSKEPSPRSDDGIPDNKVRVGLSNPMELLRSRSLLKEEFILAESRPSDPFMASSGSDPASSSSSLSTASSSPREGALGLGRAAYRRSDPSLLTVTLREKAMKGTGFRKSDPLVVRRSEKSGEGAAAKSSSEFDISKDKSPVDNASAPAARGSSVGTVGKVTRSQSLRLSHHPDQQQGASAASSGCLKRSQSIGSVASESDGKRSGVKDSAPGVQVQDLARGAPFSGKGRMVVVRDTFSEFDNVFADSSARCAHPQPPSSSCSSSVQSSAKRSSEVKPESAYIKHSFEKHRHSSSEDTVISESPRMSVSDVAISAVNQSDSGAAPKSLSPSSFIIQGAQKQPGNTNVSKPPVPNHQSASNSNKSAGQKTVLSQASKQMSVVGKDSAPSKAKPSVSASSAPSNMQTNERKSCEELHQGAGKGTGADVKSSLTHPPHVSASALSNNPESKCVSAGESTDTGKDRFVTVAAKVSLKDRDSSPDPTAVPVNRTTPTSGNSSISKPTMSKTGPTVSSTSPSPHSGGQSPAQRSTSSRQPSAQRSSSSRQTSAVRKSASTESLATPRFSAHGRQWSGESGGRQSTISSSQRSLSTSARDVTARLSGSGSSSSRASSTNSLSNARSDMIPTTKSDVSVAGKTSAKPLKNNTAQSVSKGAVPAKAQPSQTSTSKSMTLSPTADSTSKPVAAISAATPKAVAKVMQTTTKAVTSPPQSRTTVMMAQSTVSASSPNAAPVESSKCRASSSAAAASAQNSVNSKPTSSATTAPMQGKSGQTGSSKTGVTASVQTAKPSSMSGSGGLTDQKSMADSRGAKCKGSVRSSKSPALMKSSSDSVLVEPEGSGDKVESMEKAEIEDSNAPSGEGIEPLVKITFSGMNPKTSSNISKYSDPATLVNTGPVIVNPFENLSAHHASRDKSPGDIDAATEAGFIVGKPDKDAAGKKKVPTSAKGKAVKGAKKAKDPKRPLSSSSCQASAGKRRGAKGKDPKVSDTDDARPKSGKRVRSGKRRAKKAAEREADKEAALLSEMASKGDVAVISGIGWHVATTCADTSDVIAAPEMHIESSDSDISDVESIEDAETLMTKLEINRSNISLTSPRFREIKAQGGQHDAIAAIPALTSDGFPPMNLDINPKGSSMQTDDADKDHVITDFEDMNDEVHKELLLRKLTPIPEMPSINGPLGNVTEAIARFDRSLKDNQLSEWLDGTPRTDINPTSSRRSPAQGGQDSSKKGKSTTTEDGAKETDIKTNEANISKPPHIEISQPSPVPKDNKHAPRRTQSLKEGSTGAKKERPRRERKFSESKKDEEEINTAIEEILSATSTSMSSTLKSTSTLKSGSNTLTEGDHHVLLKLKSHCKESPFHASKPSQEEEDEDASTLCGENSGGSGEGLADETNPNLLKVTHMEQFDLGAKVKAMIDAGADESKIKAMMNADQGVKHQEAKQIVKVMNSFRHMELHAGSSQNPREPLLRSESHRVPKVGTAVDRVPLVRPSSAGASRSRGRFQELKKSSPGGSAQHLADRTRRSESEEPAEKEVVVGAHGGYAAVVEALAGDVARDVLGGTAASETMCSRLSRHSSRSGSACTEDSQEEETIQWKKGNVLGKGAFGTVWCGLTNEGELIAVKQIELNTADRQKAEREYEKVQEEVELLKTLNHINIVGYLGTSLDDSTVSIFMQFVPGGSIASILARFGALDESVFRRYTRQILQGVEYLHDNDVIHRDIKGGNVMLMPNGIIKLIDFGCAKRLCINLSLSQSQILRSMKGTPYWMAPEVVNESGHGKKSDIWSIGCTVFEMATRRPPWAEMNPMAAIFAIGSDRTVPSLPNKFSPEAIAFVNRCLTRDQQYRPSATELLTDIFMVEQPSKK